jgi:DNA-binding transcriptional LysR family regulator
LIPALTPLLRANPNVQAHFQNAEIRELPELLLTGNVDFIVTDAPIHRADIETVELGAEEYVLCESAKIEGADRYLDHDPGDTTTHRFLSNQARSVPEYQRAFMDEIYAVIDGVATGLGKAVVSRHLIARDRRIKVLPRYKSMDVRVLLQHHKQPYYTALQQAAIKQLVEKCPDLLRSAE